MCRTNYQYQMLRLLPFAVLLLTTHLLLFTASAQTTSATLSGVVEDENGAAIPGCKITVLSEATGLRRTVQTDDTGMYIVPLLPPGIYTISAEQTGFKRVQYPNVILNVNDHRSLRIQLSVGSLEAAIEVRPGESLIDESPAVSTTVDRTFVQNLPLNGRSFQSLITLTPGTVLTRANNEEQGQFSVNGQRANANYFTIDGVGANIGVGFAFAPGQALGGSVPGFSASGGTNNLVSVDALQEFKVQTSSYAPEFGRTPGAQVQIVTRSGTNEFHGSLYEYFRNDKLDANDWFNNLRGLARPATRQNNFGGVVGGPVYFPLFGEGTRKLYNGKNRTFFFFSYEGLRLRQPQSATTLVPSRQARQNAPAQIKPFLNAFPIPTGPDRSDNLAEFASSFSIPTTLDSTSIRIDHSINKNLVVFGRVNIAPSETAPRGVASTSLNTVNPSTLKTEIYTAGSTWVINTKATNELRFNFSRNRSAARFELDDFGGGMPLDGSQAFPSPFSSQDAIFSFRVSFSGGAAILLGSNTEHIQRQINVIDNFSVEKGNHQLKFGIDYRRLFPIFGARKYFQSANFSNVNRALTGVTTSASIQSLAGPHVFIFDNLSLYGQDVLKVNRRLTLTYGLRWEFNPPPHEANGNNPATVTGLENPATLTLAPPGTLLYEATYNNFAPRFGAALSLSQKRGKETILRGGFGLFYDLGYGSIANSLRGYPFSLNKSLGATPFPYTPAQAAPPVLNPTAQITEIFAVDPHLKLPLTYEWNLSLERSLGSNQTVSVTYLGAAGRRLLRQELLVSPNPRFLLVNATRNAATSDYNGLQLQFTRRVSSGLQAVASYTWSKSLDVASNDSSLNPPGVRLDPSLDRGPSDFDFRHVFNAALTYDLPSPKGGFARALLQHWALDTIFAARSSPPINVTVTNDIGFGTYDFRPDLIQGVPLYRDDPLVAGGRRINSAAFSIPTGRQGTLGRNALRGFPLYQVDLGLRRQIKMTDRLALQLKAEIFNLFNHPNFGYPDGILDSFGGLSPNPNFGVATRMLGRNLGSGGQLGGFNPLYQVGGPRSVQLSLKLLF